MDIDLGLMLVDELLAVAEICTPFVVKMFFMILVCIELNCILMISASALEGA